MPPQRPSRRAEPAARGLYEQREGTAYEVAEAKREKPSPFPAFVKKTGNAFPDRTARDFPEDVKESLAFLQFDFTPVQYHGTAKFFGYVLVGLMVLVFGALVVLGLPSEPAVRLPGLVLTQLHVLAVVAISASVAFAKRFGLLMLKGSLQSQVNRERALALGHVPEIVNYLVMSMRLSPNLEKAVEFAALHGRGRIAEDLKTLVYYTQIGKYETIEEGLDELAYRWGPVNEDFKHALILIRTSVLEADRQRRDALLEKSISDVLEGSREKMDLYARALHQPTVYLYYFGILLPLMLAIVLPIGSSLVPGLEFGKPEYLFAVYVLFIPAGVYAFGKSILSGRPPTYVPPDIPPNYPGLPPRGTVRVLGVTLNVALAAALAFGGIVFAGYAADQAVLAGIPAFRFEQEVAALPKLTLFGDPAKGGAFVGMFSIFGFLIGASAAASVYLLGTFGARKNVQDEIRGMESEFKDAMYVLASRLGENRPIEDAMQHAIDFLPKSKVANTTFRRIVENITTLGMTLDSAIFDKTYGALRQMPSNVLRSGFKIMIDAVGLGVNVASRSLLGLSIQLRDAQKIDDMLKRLLEDVTTMLSTMATFIAPIVLAVVSAMQQLIISSLASASAGTETVGGVGTPATAGFGGGLTGLFKADSLKNAADPATFSLIMGLYVLEIVVLLTYFNAQVEDTNNPLHTYTSIAKALPIAAILYCAAIFVVGGAIQGV